MTMRLPASPIDLACDRPDCGALAGEPCTETVGSAANPVVHARPKPHLTRVHRYERACADWGRIEKLRELVGLMSCMRDSHDV